MKRLITAVTVGVVALVYGCCNVRVGSNSQCAVKSPCVNDTRAVVVEAESTHKNINVGSHYWKLERQGKASHLYAFPADNTVFDRRNITNHSPGVEYLVNFEQPGTYYLWVKGQGEAGGASVIPGLDGTPLTEDADFMGFFPAGFSWIGGLHDTGKRAVLGIDSVGEHRINFWMLEDGFRLDTFMLTTDAGFIPE